MKFASLGKQTDYAVFDARNGPGIIDSFLRNQVAMTSDETAGWRPKTLKQVAAETALSIPSAFNPQTAFMSLHAFLQEASGRPPWEILPRGIAVNAVAFDPCSRKFPANG